MEPGEGRGRGPGRGPPLSHKKRGQVEAFSNLRLPKLPWLQVERRGSKGAGVHGSTPCAPLSSSQTRAPRPSRLSAQDLAAGTWRCWGWNPSSCAGCLLHSSRRSHEFWFWLWDCTVIVPFPPGGFEPRAACSRGRRQACSGVWVCLQLTLTLVSLPHFPTSTQYGT